MRPLEVALSPIVTLFVPLVVGLVAYAIAGGELRRYRDARRDPADDTLWAQARGRFARRMTGVAVLAALALTFLGLGVLPPRTARGAEMYLALILAEVGVLVVLPLWELIGRAGAARPEGGATRPGAARRRTRTGPRRPPSAGTR